MIYPNIEAERARIGLSKEKFAKTLGVATKTYYNWLNGVNPIPSDVLIKISDISGAKIDYLLGRARTPTQNVDQRSFVDNAAGEAEERKEVG